MPLPGGASDKAGNSYERRWTVFKITELLERGSGAIRIEVPGDAGLGAEFRLTKDNRSEWHQVKRQRAAGNWSIRALRANDVLGPWWPKLTAGDTCWFVSGVGAPELKELADRSRSAGELDRVRQRLPIRKATARELQCSQRSVALRYG